MDLDIVGLGSLMEQGSESNGLNCSRRGFLAAAGVFAAGSLISTFAPAPIKAFAAPGSDVIPQPAIELRCNADGCFKIISFADLHGDADHLAPQVVQRIERLLDREQPDLVVLDGDNTWLMDNEDDLRGCVADIAAPMEDRGIPWAHVYGNHDAEGSAPDKASQHAIYTSHPHCVSQQGPGDIYGMENYVLPILAHDSDEIVFNIWCIDSGEYISGKLRNQLYPDQSMFRGLRNSHYAHVSPSVVNWYYQQSKAIEDELGRKVPGIMFAHIPVQECYALWLNRNSLVPTGSKHDSVSSGELNSGLFAAALERGDVKAMVFGHDHYNDYAADYCGIRLCYSSTVSELGRYTPDIEPVSDWENTLAGARVLRLYQDGSFDTYISYLRNADWTIIDLDAPESIPLGSELTYRAVIGGRGEGLKYNYVWRFGEDWQYWSSTVKETGEMTSEDSFTFTPDRIGVYSLWVDVQDAAGHRATSHTASLQVLRPDAFAWSLQGVSAPESIELGHTLTFSAIVEGTPKDASFNYAWSWEGNWGDDWDSTVKSTGEMTQDTSFTFTPRKLGTYYLWVDVKDAFGESATSEQIAVQVLAKQCPWKLTGVQVSTSGFVGGPVSFSAILEGETEGLRFNYAWSEGGGWSNWGSTKKDTGTSTTETTGSFTPRTAGDYYVWIDVEDDEFSSTSDMTLVHVDEVPPAWRLTGVEVASSAVLGETVTFSAVIEGDDSGLMYNYAWSWEGHWGDDWDSTIKSTGSKTNEREGSFVANKTGSYYVWLDVEDANGRTVTSDQAVVTVTDAAAANSYPELGPEPEPEPDQQTDSVPSVSDNVTTGSPDASDDPVEPASESQSADNPV